MKTDPCGSGSTSLVKRITKGEGTGGAILALWCKQRTVFRRGVMQRSCLRQCSRRYSLVSRSSLKRRLIFCGLFTIRNCTEIKKAITIAIGIGLYWCIACQNRELEVRETPLLYCLNPCKDVISLNNERVLPEGHQIKITIKQLSKQSQSVKVGKSYALNGT